MRVAHAVGQVLTKLGVELVFGVVGSGNFAVTNALTAAGARFVAARHEGGAISMADAYARVLNTVGVCSVHQGPGFTNALTGLVEAAKSRVPLLVLAADTPTAAFRSTFRIDQGAFATTAGAIVERVHSADTVVADTVRAFGRARVERRPVVMLLPLDVQAAECADALPALPRLPSLHRSRPSADAVTAVVDLMAQARRPAIIAGRGAVLGNARRPLELLAERTGAILATTAVANGLFTGNPFDVGVSGGFASPVAARLLADADVVLAFGAALTYWTTRHGALIGLGARVVQVDLDEAAIGRQHPVDVGIVADAAETAQALVDGLARRGHSGRGYRTDDLAEQIARGRWRELPYDDGSGDGWIDPRTLTIALDELLPLERTVVVDSGHFMGWPTMYLPPPDPAGFVFAQAFQSIGLGLGGAVGAALARPDRLTVAALGDGGALMALPELETVGRLGIPMLVVVYDDAAYGAEVHHFGPMGEPVDIVRFPDTDIAALARAAGAEGITVRHLDDLSPVADWLGDRSGPMVVDAKVHPGIRGDWLAEAFRSG